MGPAKMGESHYTRYKMCYTKVIMFNRLICVASLISLVVLAVMVNLTTPSGVGPLGVLVFFTMVYIVVFEIVILATRFVYLMMGKKTMVRKDYYQAGVIAFGPIMLLLVQSFGPMQLWKIGAIILFVFLGCFVVKKRI